ncbi:hypothetical protein C6366_17285 [Desulfonatronum sp. SC1]|nr:hypothetical protein C6366_17285 [Desulfonatronum sp. SC1]
MIYKSLKQAGNQGQERKSKARFFNPAGADLNQRRVIKRFALYALIVVIFLWGAVYLLQTEMQRIAGMINERVVVDTVFHEDRYTDPYQQSWGETTYDDDEEHDSRHLDEDVRQQPEVVISEVRPVPRIIPMTGPRSGPPRTTSSPPLPEVRAAPTAPVSTPPVQEPNSLGQATLDQELQSHFLAQTHRNNELLALERQTVHLEQSTLELADAMEQRLGPQSMHALRLRGYDALKAGDFDRAETIFRESLARNPRDKTTRMNLVLALMGQDKQREARQIHDDLARAFPLDEDVTRLRSIFQ